MRKKFTKRFLDTLTPPDSGRATYHDEATDGLQLRVSSSGTKTFCVYRRAKGGAPERITLGRYPDLPLEAARRKAREVVADLAQGTSVAAEIRRKRVLNITLAEVFDDYLFARKGLKPLTVEDMHKAMRQVLPDWLDKPIAKITPRMVETRHREYGERSQARANLAMRYLRALVNFAIAKYTDETGEPIINRNPVKRLSDTRAWYRVERKRSLIKAHELPAWFAAVEVLPKPDIRDYFLFLLFTGLRREEALQLTWDRIDLTGRTFVITDPKNHKPHELPMSDFLHDMLAQRKETSASSFVFADTQGRRISNFRYALAGIERSSGIKFSPHDLRRTFATIAESLDIPAYALKRLLNHSDGADVTAGYIVANTERLREPMQKITDYLLKAGGRKPSGEVVSLSRSA